MNFQYSAKVDALVARLEAFMAEHILPVEHDYERWCADPARLWQVWPGLADLKAKARAAGLWNLFLPEE